MFVKHKESQNSINIFAAPFAGGGINCYRDIIKPIQKVNFFSLELPGRQRLINASPFVSMSDLVEKIVISLQNKLYEPYILYGHSMGGWIAFDLMVLLQKRKLPLPKALIASASRAPNCMHDEVLKLMNAETFNDWLMELKFPLQDKKLIHLLKPALIADFTMIATRQKPILQKYPVPFYIFYSQDDPIASYAQVKAWQEFTSSPCQYHEVKGGHFFIYEQQRLMQEMFLHILDEVSNTHIQFESYKNDGDYKCDLTQKIKMN